MVWPQKLCARDKQLRSTHLYPPIKHLRFRRDLVTKFSEAGHCIVFEVFDHLTNELWLLHLTHLTQDSIFKGLFYMTIAERILPDSPISERPRLVSNQTGLTSILSIPACSCIHQHLRLALFDRAILHIHLPNTGAGPSDRLWPEA